MPDPSIPTPDEVTPGPTPTSNNPPQTVKFTAAGAAREMPLEEALQWASKGFGAEEKFRTAADIKREYETKIQGHEALQKKQADIDAACQGDMDAFRRVAADWGIDEAQVEAAVAAHEASPTGSRPPGTPSVDPRYLKTLRTMEKLINAWESEGIDPVKALTQARDFQTTEVKQKLKTIVTQALERDPILGHLVKDPQKSQAIREDAWNRVDGKFRKNTPVVEAIQEAFSELKGVLTAFDNVAGSSRSGGVHPGSFGTTPTSDAGLSRLQPPKEPKMEDYPGDLSGYIKAKMTFEEWNTQNSG